MRTLTITLAVLLTLTACGDLPPVDNGTPDAGQTDSGTDPVVDWAFGGYCDTEGAAHCYGPDVVAVCAPLYGRLTLQPFACPGGCTEDGTSPVTCDWTGARVGTPCPRDLAPSACATDHALDCMDGVWTLRSHCIAGLCETVDGEAMCPVWEPPEA